MRQSFAKPPSQSDYSVAEDLARILLTPIVDPESARSVGLSRTSQTDRTSGAQSNCTPSQSRATYMTYRSVIATPYGWEPPATCARTMSEVNCRQVIEPASHPP